MNTPANAEAIRAAWKQAGLDGGALKDLRRDGLEQFLHNGLPTTRQEDWKYTDLRGLADRLTEDLGRLPAETPSHEDSLGISDAIQITFVDGVFRPELSALGDIPAGVRLNSIAALAETQPETLHNLYGKLAIHSDSAMVGAQLSLRRTRHGAGSR